MSDENAVKKPTRTKKVAAETTVSPNRDGPSLSDVPNLAALVGAIALGLSFCRQFGFYVFIDARLMSFMSLTDVVANSLQYLPLSIFSVLANIGFRVYRIDPPQSKIGFGIATWLFSPQPRWSLVLYIFLTTFFVVTSIDWPGSLMLISIFVFGDLVEWTRRRGFVDAIPYFVVLLLFALLGSNLFLAGASEALGLRGRSPDYALTLSGSSVPVPVVLLRSTEDFLLVRLADGRLDNISKSQVVELQQINAHDPKPFLPLPDLHLGELWNWMMGLWPFGSAPTQTNSPIITP